MKKLIVLTLILSACAQTPKEEILVKQSHHDSMAYKSDSPWWAANFNPLNESLQIFTWDLAYDQTCESAAVFKGGTLTVALSTQTSKPQNTDIACPYFDGDWTYSINQSGLIICKAGSPCVTMN